MLHSAGTSTKDRRLTCRLKNARGFTLIELMATLVILALIIAIAVPAIGNITTKAAEQARLASIELIENAGEIAHIDDLPFDTEKPASVTETDVYLIPTLVEKGYLKLKEDSEFYDDEQWVRKMNKSGMFKYMGRGDGTTPDPGDGGGETPEEPEVPVEPEEPELVNDYCPAEGRGEVGEYTIVNLKSGGARLKEYNGTDPNIVMPSSYCGTDVTEIYGSALRWYEGSSKTKLESVVLPERVQKIGYQAFQNNGLTSIFIPETVKLIDGEAFHNNVLTDIRFAEGISELSIGSIAFGNNKLTTIDVPDGVVSLGARVFMSNNLTSMSLPSSITTIPFELFRNNDFTSLTLPPTVSTIGPSAFADNEIVSLDLPETVTTIESDAFFKNKLTSVVVRNPNVALTGGGLQFSNSDHKVGDRHLLTITGGSAVKTYAEGKGFTYRPL